MKVDKFDRIVSLLVRERADWTCESCGRNFFHDQVNLHCSHFHGRIRQSTRYDLDNCQAHCSTCHKMFTDHPNIHTAHYVKARGQGMLDLITEKARSIKKWERPSKKTGYNGEKEEMYKHYKTEYKRLLDLRAQGVRGWIKVVNW